MSANHNAFGSWSWRLVRGALAAFGALALLLVALAATPVPWLVYGWMGSDPQPLRGEPDYIVLLGGGGIPSESGLMRCYQTALMAGKHPHAQVMVAMPFEEGEDAAHPGPVVRELVLRGVARDRIRQEGHGRYTHEQAMNARAMIPRGAREPVVLLVTSPEHMRRSLHAFRRVGFAEVHGSSVYSQDLAADLTYGKESAAGQRVPVPAVGQSLLLRYRLWDNLELEVRLLRELAALVYYRVKGWT